MTADTIAEIAALIAVPTWFIVHKLEQVVDRIDQARIEFKRFNDREEGLRPAKDTDGSNIFVPD
jgi:hypothetical protein